MYKAILHNKRMPTINKKTNKQKTIEMPNESARYYNSKWWKTLRNGYIRNNPLCYMCAINGRSTAAEEVHHKTPFMTGKTEEERWNLLLDPDNLISLCKDCHREIHRQMK